MSKQTAVDWLEEQYYESEGKLTRHDFEQAKAMHKEEIIKSNRAGVDMVIDKENFYVTGEQYYNETYGGNNEQH
jgi:hypothetical protein